MTVATQTQPSGKLLDYEQFIDHQLERTRRRIKLTDIATAGLTLWVGFLVILFLEVVGDHLFGLPFWLRLGVLIIGLTAASVYGALRVVVPLVRRINGLYAAKTIEGAEPGFKNSLINYLELKRQREQLPRAVLVALESRAVNDLTQVDVEAAVNQHRMVQMVYALSAAVVVFCIYWAVSPRNPFDSVRRAFLADVVRPTNTQLVNIKPGDNPDLSDIVAGQHVTFEVGVQGVRPEKVLLHHSVDGGKFFAIKELAPGKKMYDPWQFTMTNVQQSMEYYLTGGDAESRHYHLNVEAAPTIVDISHDLEFPAYAKIEARKNLEGGEVEALVGTTVTVRAKANMPVSLATINFASQELRPQRMEVAEDDPTHLVGKFTVEKSGTYRINFRTIKGQVNPSPVNYDIIAIEDRQPTARFILPDKATIKLPANVKVDLVMAGSDDHGIKDATLHYQMGKEPPTSKNLLEGQEPRTEFRTTETLDLAKIGAKPGDKVTYWLTVRDNKEPASNRADTGRQFIEVTDAVSPETKKQMEDKQRQDREQVNQGESLKSGDASQAPPQEALPEEAQENQQQEGGASDPTQPGRPGAQQGPGRNAPRPGQGGNADQREEDQNDQPQNAQNGPTPEQLRKMQDILNKRQSKGAQQGQRNARGGAPGKAPQSGNAREAQSPSGASPPQGDQNREGSNAGAGARGQRQAGGQPGGPQGEPGNANPSDQVQPGIREEGQPTGQQGQSGSTPGGQGPRQADRVGPGQRDQGLPRSGDDTQGAKAKPADSAPGGAAEPKPGGQANPPRSGANPANPNGPDAKAGPGGENRGQNPPNAGGANQPRDEANLAGQAPTPGQPNPRPPGSSSEAGAQQPQAPPSPAGPRQPPREPSTGPVINDERLKDERIPQSYDPRSPQVPNAGQREASSRNGEGATPKTDSANPPDQDGSNREQSPAGGANTSQAGARPGATSPRGAGAQQGQPQTYPPAGETPTGEGGRQQQGAANSPNTPRTGGVQQPNDGGQPQAGTRPGEAGTQDNRSDQRGGQQGGQKDGDQAGTKSVQQNADGQANRANQEPGKAAAGTNPSNPSGRTGTEARQGQPQGRDGEPSGAANPKPASDGKPEGRAGELQKGGRPSDAKVASPNSQGERGAAGNPSPSREAAGESGGQQEAGPDAKQNQAGQNPNRATEAGRPGQESGANGRPGQSGQHPQGQTPRAPGAENPQQQGPASRQQGMNAQGPREAVRSQAEAGQAPTPGQPNPRPPGTSSEAGARQPQTPSSPAGPRQPPRDQATGPVINDERLKDERIPKSEDPRSPQVPSGGQREAGSHNGEGATPRTDFPNPPQDRQSSQAEGPTNEARKSGTESSAGSDTKQPNPNPENLRSDNKQDLQRGGAPNGDQQDLNPGGASGTTKDQQPPSAEKQAGPGGRPRQTPNAPKQTTDPQAKGRMTSNQTARDTTGDRDSDSRPATSERQGQPRTQAAPRPEPGERPEPRTPQQPGQTNPLQPQDPRNPTLQDEFQQNRTPSGTQSQQGRQQQQQQQEQQQQQQQTPRTDQSMPHSSPMPGQQSGPQSQQGQQQPQNGAPHEPDPNRKGPGTSQSSDQGQSQSQQSAQQQAGQPKPGEQGGQGQEGQGQQGRGEGQRGQGRAQAPGQSGQGEGQGAGEGQGQMAGRQPGVGSEPGEGTPSDTPGHQGQGSTGRGQPQGGNTSGENGSSEPGSSSGGRSGSASQTGATSTGGQGSQGSSSAAPGQGGQQRGAGGTPGSGPTGGGPGTGQRPGGGNGRNLVGGGGAGTEPTDAPRELPDKDESQPAPRAKEPENVPLPDDVAPAGTEQSSLQLRGLSDALKDAATAKELEDATGMTKEQLDQFARRYEKPSNLKAGREGKDVEVKVGEQPAAAPAANNPGARVRTFTTDKLRGRGIPTDTARGNLEGARDVPPPEFRERYEAYKIRLARPKTSARRTAQPK